MDPNQEDPKSLLTNLRQHHIVHVHNPLSEDFTWSVARSVIHMDSRYRDQFIEKLNMRNDSHPTMNHVQQKITIPAGKSMKLPGDAAQVLVKHLVDEVIARGGQKNMQSDPVVRRTYEEQVILNINDLKTQLSSQSIEEQLEQQLKDLNQEEPKGSIAHATTETSFPSLDSARQGDGSATIPDPPPGTGVEFTPSPKTAAAK